MILNLPIYSLALQPLRVQAFTITCFHLSLDPYLSQTPPWCVFSFFLAASTSSFPWCDNKDFIHCSVFGYSLNMSNPPYSSWLNCHHYIWILNKISTGSALVLILQTPLSWIAPKGFLSICFFNLIVFNCTK